MDRIVLARCTRLLISRRSVLPKIAVVSSVQNFQNFHTTSVSAAGRSWRIETGRSGNGNTYGPLADLPDWSYADGRPAPLGTGQQKRLAKQKEYADIIYKTVHAIEKAKEEIASATKARVEKPRLRLKPKGSGTAM